jgi:hypothetical protein
MFDEYKEAEEFAMKGAEELHLSVSIYTSVIKIHPQPHYPRSTPMQTITEFEMPFLVVIVSVDKCEVAFFDNCLLAMKFADEQAESGSDSSDVSYVCAILEEKRGDQSHE